MTDNKEGIFFPYLNIRFWNLYRSNSCVKITLRTTLFVFLSFTHLFSSLAILFVRYWFIQPTGIFWAPRARHRARYWECQTGLFSKGTSIPGGQGRQNKSKELNKIISESHSTTEKTRYKPGIGIQILHHLTFMWNQKSRIHRCGEQNSG